MLRRILFGLGITGTWFLLAAGSVSALNPLCNATSAEGISPEALQQIQDSEACQDGTNKITGPGGLISKVTQIVSVVAGVAAVVMIMYGGFLYMTSGGDTGKVQEAKKTIVWSVIGLLVIVSARTIILFVINRV